MTEAEHNRPIPKLFSNRPSASAAEGFGPINWPLKISWKKHVQISYFIAILISKKFSIFEDGWIYK